MKDYLIDSQYFAYIVVLAVLQRYDFESNSQPASPVITFEEGVYRIAKVQFWNQITTFCVYNHGYISFHRL